MPAELQLKLGSYAIYWEQENRQINRWPISATVFKKLMVFHHCVWPPRKYHWTRTVTQTQFSGSDLVSVVCSSLRNVNNTKSHNWKRKIFFWSFIQSNPAKGDASSLLCSLVLLLNMIQPCNEVNWADQLKKKKALVMSYISHFVTGPNGQNFLLLVCTLKESWNLTLTSKLISVYFNHLPTMFLPPKEKRKRKMVKMHQTCSSVSNFSF